LLVLCETKWILFASFSPYYNGVSGMGTARWSDFFATPRQAAESRMRAMSSSPLVRKARAKAEVEFRSKEVAADWHKQTRRVGHDWEVPPHWQAGVQYASEIIPAYATLALDEFAHPGEFEAFLRECESIVSQRTHERKLQPYDRAPFKDLSRVQTDFYQLVRAAVAAENARLSLEAWQRYRERLEKETAPMVIAPTTNGNGTCTNAAPPDPGALAAGREGRLQEFVTANHTTIAAVCDAAQVHKPDMQRWRRGELSDDSVMAQRIENVLSGETPLKTGDTKPAPAA
jgi:hypothetical protein